MFHVAYIGLVGLPNAGKSSLLNHLVGEKLAIVTHKAQTTRKRLEAILTRENQQIVLVDSPGVIDKKNGLNAFLKHETKEMIRDVDALLVCLSIDSRNPEELDKIVQMAAQSKKPLAILIMKRDLPKPQRIALLHQRYQDYGVPILSVSVKENPEELRQRVFELCRPWLKQQQALFYDADDITTENLRDLCSELIREKCLELLHDEIPYGLGVLIRDFSEEEKLTKIYADIIVEKQSAKAIVIGKKGQHLKKIGEQSRASIEKLLQTKVYLELFVRVESSWTQNESRRREFGYAP